MLLNWFDAKEAKAFGLWLANFYLQRTSSEPGGHVKHVAQKQAELLHKVSDEITRFKVEHKLNIYRKAQLANAFKWTLRDAGIDQKYADELTSWLMLRF